MANENGICLEGTAPSVPGRWLPAVFPETTKRKRHWLPVHATAPVQLLPQTGGAGETVQAGENLAILEVLGRNVPQKEGAAVAQSHVEHLVEVAIVKFAAPADAQRAAAHQAIDGAWVEAVDE